MSDCIHKGNTLAVIIEYLLMMNHDRSPLAHTGQDRGMPLPRRRGKAMRLCLGSAADEILTLCTELLVPQRAPPCEDTAEASLRSDTADIHPLANKADKHKFLLLTLPIEIRLLIYDLLLVRPFPLSATNVNMWPRKRELLPRGLHPAMLLTSKHVYQEAILSLYSRNVFNIHTSEWALRFMAQTNPANAVRLCSLEL
jgi:hypothetical protein